MELGWQRIELKMTSMKIIELERLSLKWLHWNEFDLKGLDLIVKERLGKIIGGLTMRSLHKKNPEIIWSYAEIFCPRRDKSAT